MSSFVVAVPLHPLADGVASEIELLRERLVDDRDLRRAQARRPRVNSRPARSGTPSVRK